MKINLWVRGNNIEFLEDKINLELTEYEHARGIFEGKTEDYDGFNSLNRDFVFGKLGMWKSGPLRLYFVYIKNNSEYPNGLMLTPYPKINFKHDFYKDDETTKKIYCRKLLGRDNEDLIYRIFFTYHSKKIKKASEKDNNFLLYLKNLK